MFYEHKVHLHCNAFAGLTHKVPNTTIAEFANTLDPDETWIYSVCPLVFDFSTVCSLFKSF